MEFLNDLASIIVSDGIFAGLFIWLFFFQIKDSSKRESKYQKTIEELTKHLKVIDEVKSELGAIKRHIFKEKKNDEKPNGKDEKL